MAGDWIPICVELPQKPEVARLAALTQRSVDEVVGLLVRFWAWAQAHTTDGELPGMTCQMVEAASHVPASFLERLADVGWLMVTDAGLTIPSFTRWLGGGAKRRLRTREAMRRARGGILSEQNVSAQCSQVARSVRTQCDHTSATRTAQREQAASHAGDTGVRSGDATHAHAPPQATLSPDITTTYGDSAAPEVSAQLPKCEQNVSAQCSQNVHQRIEREKEKRNNIPPHRSPPRPRVSDASAVIESLALPSECDTPEIRRSLADWLAYRRRIGKPYRDPEQQLTLLVRRYGPRVSEAIEHSIAQGYQGAFLPRDATSREKPCQPTADEPPANYGGGIFAALMAEWQAEGKLSQPPKTTQKINGNNHVIHK